jgi:NodT family efflux transporter outer membrane factor (OMF) lipoprotein
MDRLVLRLAAALVALAATGAGCAVGPDAPPPLAPPPPRFAEAPTATAAPAPPDFAFWNTFEDPLLTRLVERALGTSPDVGVATARINEARAEAGIAKAALFPSIDAVGVWNQQRLSLEGPIFGQLNVNQINPTFQQQFQDFRGALTMAYEIDVWGKYRRGHEAALDDLAARVEDRRAVGLALAGDVAAAYIDMRTYERRLAIAEKTRNARRAQLDLERSRFGAGISSDFIVSRAEVLLENAEAAIPEMARQRALAAHRLAILVGEPPSALAAEVATATARPLAPFEVPAGVPAQLLARRPDVRAASAELAAATARIGQTKADLFPQLHLDGEVGFESINISTLANHQALYWLAGPRLQIPLFDAGRRLDALDAADARAQRALSALERSVLTALGEVEDALSNAREDARRRAALSRAAEAARREATIARKNYEEGLISSLDVVESDREEFATQDALAEAEGRVAIDAVRLAKAVAGGFAVVEELLPSLGEDEVGTR